ncbi:DNA-directed RNA polymerase, mitochondrial isoform X6 [Leptonychotes weddellii]|uniref:DNA-directed RNA polymerase n=1 Tax=Leptonychotes weddellii TaxID=9713 RepID=A0A7F8QAL2_LEPWE|nr:DNA-directed RNA polymerase, mitochondrial isoform X6 [Leptonychotes weddellii]
MSALRWGHGASGLRRALWPAGRPGPLAEEGALSGVWGRRRSSSANPCEQDRRKDWGHAELLEVLEARVRQLQAESVSEVTVKRVGMARRLPASGGFQPPGRAQMGPEDAATEVSGRWAQKLDKEKFAMEKRKQRLEVKLQVRAQQLACEHRLRVVPRLLDAQLASCLQRWEHGAPRSHWEEQLAQLLQEAPRKLSHEAGQAPQAESASVRRESQQQRLLAFFECCLLTGHLPLAHHVLVTFHSRFRQQRRLTLAMYNTVMLGWARKGSFKELVYVFFMVKDAGLTPDLLSYAAALQCMGRLDQDTNTIQRCLDQMARDGLKLQGLFTSMPLCQEEQAMVLRAVHKAQPAFSLPPRPRPPPQVNTSPLLREIYAKQSGPVSYPKLHLPLQKLQSLFQQQLDVEMATTVAVESVEKARVLTKEVLQARNTLKQLRAEWVQALSLGLQELKASEARAARAGRCTIFPYLCVLTEEELAELLLQTLQVLPPQGESLLSLAQQLGLRVFNRHTVHRKQLSSQVRALQQRYHSYLHLLASDTPIGILKPHPAFTELLATAAERTLTFEAAEVPMLCPPLPWTSPHAGAFLLSPTKLMRSLEGTMQHQRLLDGCPPAELHGALDALTQLGNCAWRVNGRVLDLVLELFAAKGCPRLGVPAPPSEAPRPPEGRLPPGASPAHKAKVRRELARCLKVAREMHSLRSDALYRLSLAQHLRHRVFWLPHNMDFRGRTYPCPPHFNHLGSDLARALLEFAQGRPLGPHGLDWLKIHLVNLTGLKKHEPLQARLVFADEVMEDILDSADRPMTGRKWWMEVDEPWQALACCMEIARAVRAPDPAAYVSHFPVHQDGSCNGLQHYAALGRDSVGAASVNLLPSDLPQDVYSGVAAQVEVFRRQDAERGVRVAQVLEGFISRKVVKQTVMTVVYGVTRYGGRLQIEKRLRELSNFPQEFVWEASHYLVRQVFNSLQEMFSGTRAIQHWLTESARLIAHTGSAVEWVTPLGIPIIQPYHQDSKVLISGGIQSLTFSQSGDTSQKPNTLKQKNGFPPNFIHSLDSSHMMLTALHCYRGELSTHVLSVTHSGWEGAGGGSGPRRAAPLHGRPSPDGRKGLTFVSVHDCFWTHAADVEVMNQVCREQFVRLHSQPILHDLSRFLVKRFCSGTRSPKHSKNAWIGKLQDTLKSVPKTGAFDLEQVKHSTYFFS